MDAVRTVSRLLTRSVVMSAAISRAIVHGVRSADGAARAQTDSRTDPPLTAMGG